MDKPSGPKLPPRPLPSSTVGGKPPPRAPRPTAGVQGIPPRAPRPVPTQRPAGPGPAPGAPPRTVQPPPRNTAPGLGEQGPTTQRETLNIAGTQLECIRALEKVEEGPIQIQTTSWLCRQVPGFLVRSLVKMTGLIETEAESTQIRSTSRTELLGYHGRLTSAGTPEHAWADFAPGAWVRLQTTTEEIVDGELVESQNETHQKLLSVGEEGMQVELTLSGEEGELHKELLIMTLDDAAEGADAAEDA